jgi:hypothetical protein
MAGKTGNGSKTRNGSGHRNGKISRRTMIGRLGAGLALTSVATRGRRLLAAPAEPKDLQLGMTTGTGQNELKNYTKICIEPTTDNPPKWKVHLYYNGGDRLLDYTGYYLYVDNNHFYLLCSPLTVPSS